MKKTLILSITIILTLSCLQHANAQNAEVEGSITLIKDVGTTLSFEGKSQTFFTFPPSPAPVRETKLTIGYVQGVTNFQFPFLNVREEVFIRSANEILNIQAPQIQISSAGVSDVPSLHVQGILQVGNEEIGDESFHPGMIRFNSDNNIFEGYNGECWVALSGNCPVILLEKHDPDKTPE